MKTENTFYPSSDRYQFDFSLCSIKKGFAQVDTAQDASYYGTWANPETLQIVNYCEGDVSIRTADNPDEFVQALRELKEWTDKMGYPFLGIDPGFSDTLKAKFEEIGLADMLH